MTIRHALLALAVLTLGACDLWNEPKPPVVDIALLASEYTPGAIVETALTNRTQTTWYTGPAMCSNFDRRVNGTWEPVPTGFCPARLIDESGVEPGKWLYEPVEIAPGATVIVLGQLPVDAAPGSYRRRIWVDANLDDSRSGPTYFSATFEVVPAAPETQQR